MQVMMLGARYDASTEEQREACLEDFRSRLLLSYRSGIPTPLKLVGGQELNSDSGWGCMLRVQQMMLAQCFVDILLGRDWRYSRDRDLAESSAYLDIVSCFLDSPEAPFSLHRLVDAGQQLLGKAPSAWFGPTSAARATGHLFELISQGGDSPALPSSLDGVTCVVFEDGPIFRAEVEEKLAAGARAVILLVCRRLGLDGFNAAEYRPGVEACFGLPDFQGMASGNSGSSAHFFVGTHDDDSLMLLDPHQTLPALPSLQAVRDAADAGLHPKAPLPLPWMSLNPSVCLGFVVRTPEAFAALCAKLSSAPCADVFEVLEKRPAYECRCEEETEDDMVLVS